jgi:hypothetical protein
LGEVDLVGSKKNGTKGIAAALKAPLLEFEARYAFDGNNP